MSSNAREARRLRPDQRKRSKDHAISNRKYACWGKQAPQIQMSNAQDQKTTISRNRSTRPGTSKLYTLIQMSNAKDQKTTTSRNITTRAGTSKLYTLIQMSL
jgi:hypothetical protein